MIRFIDVDEGSLERTLEGLSLISRFLGAHPIGFQIEEPKLSDKDLNEIIPQQMQVIRWRIFVETSMTTAVLIAMADNVQRELSS